jgi:molybdopterin-guanine dinucleotide biosynthesis protein A
VSGTEPEPIGAILAGGLGRRIGGAKAVVALRGRPLIHYPLAAMQAVMDETLILAKPDTKLPGLPGATVWIESDARRHPLFGIIEALSVAGGRPVVVCAADLPFVTPELIGRLALSDPGSAPATVVRCGELIQPLLGRYEPAAAPLLVQALQAGEPRMLDVIAAIGVRYLEASDPEVLFNVNAPEDVLQAAALMDSGRASRT